MKGRFFLIILLLFFCMQGISQVSVKYGKLSKEEKEYDKCDFEPEAEAVFLKHIGNIEITGAGVVIEKNVRIKILKENGLDHANISLPFYSKDAYERISNLKAQTINVDQNGDLETFEVDKKEFYTVELNDEWSEIRFTFPNVKVGSILEYEYTVVSENYMYLDKWEFQHDLPTLHSGVNAKIPEYLEYRVLIQGYRLIKKYSDNIGNSWELENLPSIKKESYLYNINDYTEKVKFQLSAYHVRESYGGALERKSMLKSWEDLATEVLTSWPYTSYMNKKGHAVDVLESLNIENLSSEEKTKKIYNYVKSNFQWNQGYRRFTYNKFNDFIDNKSGYSSEINLFLTLLLTEAGIDAYPMLISTRSNGLSSRDYPFLSQFNHLITYVNNNGVDIYLDATDPFRPSYLLSEESNVNQGFILDKKSPKWQNIEVSTNSYRHYAFVLNIENEVLNVQSNINLGGYPAIKSRKDLFNMAPSKWLKQKIKSEINIEDDSIKCQNLQEIDEPLNIKGNFSIPLIKQGKMVYINPFILTEFKENPFNNDSRYYPVQFPNTEKFSYRANFLIPENYEVVELPESQKVKLPNGYGDFTYIVSQFGNSISMQVVYNIDKLEVPPSQYQNLREYYSIIVSKLDQQMVIKQK